MGLEKGVDAEPDQENSLGYDQELAATLKARNELYYVLLIA